MLPLADACRRQPLPVRYLKVALECGGSDGLSGISANPALGRAMETAAPADRPEAAMEVLGGRVVLRGRVTECRLVSEGGLDHGEAAVEGGRRCCLTFYNEYMTLEDGEERLATFPDLITTFDTAAGAVVTTAGLREGMEITVTAADRRRLLLSAGVRDEALYAPLEQIVDRPLVPYIRDILLEP